MPKKRSTWQLTIHEDEDDIVEVHLTGPSNKVNDLNMFEVLCRGLRAWDSDVKNFQDGKAPKTITRKWMMPLTKIKAKLNPIKGKKSKSKKITTQEEKDFDHAIKLYKEFNGVDPKEMITQEVWLPDDSGGPHSMLVAIGEEIGRAHV